MLELKNIINELKNKNGCNVNYKSLELQNIKSGYMISLANYETIININNLDDIKTQKIIYKSILEKKLIIEDLRQDNRKNIFVIGLWINNNKLYIDISINMNSKKDAIKLGIKQNQYAIYDIKNDCDIELKKDVFIIYKYNQLKNDFVYLKECITRDDVYSFLKISKKGLYNCLVNSIDNFNKSKLYLNKYCIVKDEAFYRDLI